ncbi:hypothetical protein MBRA_03758 [Methylobacterium brachiatum]|nr:hypothetical protein MBRA_03758 [Methylobacterium brachiatum]
MIVSKLSHAWQLYSLAPRVRGDIIPPSLDGGMPLQLCFQRASKVLVSGMTAACLAHTSAYAGKIASIIEVAAPNSAAEYGKILSESVEAATIALEAESFDADDIATLNATYTHLLKIKISVLNDSTIVTTTLIDRTNNGQKLFKEPLLIENTTGLGYGQRAVFDSAKIKNHFSGMIGHLINVYKNTDSASKIFADCVFPPTPSSPDWNLAKYVTQTYPSYIKFDKRFTRYSIVAVPLVAFDDWCVKYGHMIPASRFKLTISGQALLVPGGVRLVLNVQGQAGQFTGVALSLSPDWSAEAAEKISIAIGSLLPSEQ